MDEHNPSLNVFRPMGGMDVTLYGAEIKKHFRAINEYEEILMALNKFQRYLYVEGMNGAEKFADLIEDRVLRDKMFQHFKIIMQNMKALGAYLHDNKREMMQTRARLDGQTPLRRAVTVDALKLENK